MTKDNQEEDPDEEFDQLLDDLDKIDSDDLYIQKQYTIRTIKELMMRSYLLGYLKGRNIINDNGV